jgi:hypothetical protein
LGAYEVQGDEQVVSLPTVMPSNDEAAPPATAVINLQPTLAVPPNGGWITFALLQGENERIYRLPITPNGTPEDITAVLDAIAPGEYSEWLNISSDGGWYILSTDRFDPECNGWPCLVITQDFVSFEVVKSGGTAVHAEYSAIANSGDLIVYKAGDGTHGRDLWAITRQGSAWSDPVELTTASPFFEHQPPGLSANGDSVIFACGDDPYASSALCEAATDGSSFTVRFQAADTGRDTLLFHPRYAPDGAIVFEGEWDGEQLWRLAPGSDTPTLISAHINDNSPCVLPSGLIVSLWLQREGNAAGLHEFKLMSADGEQYAMLLTGQDVFDIGTGCGGG